MIRPDRCMDCGKTVTRRSRVDGFLAITSVWTVVASTTCDVDAGIDAESADGGGTG
jgi:hypothetical protein